MTSFRSRLVVVLAVLLPFAASMRAQDAAQVLATSVAFNTLKNSTTLTDEQRAEVDRLAAMARASNTAGRYGEALKNLMHGMAVIRGTPWTSTTALGAALTMKLDRVVLEPASPVKVTLGQLFALDQPVEGKLTGAVSLLPMTGDEPVKVLRPLEAVAGDFTTPATFEVAVPDVADGNYRIAVSLTEGSAKPIAKNAAVHIEKGLAKRVAADKAALGALPSKQSDALRAAMPSIEYRIGMAELANAREVHVERVDFDAELKDAEAMIAAEREGRDPFAARRGDFRKAYRSAVDNTLQPYRIFVPAGYDGSKPYPLVVALHGMGGDENSYFDSVAYGKGAFVKEAERRGYLVACPKGRNTASMYLGSAETDVLDVIAEVRRAYRVDPGRIYLTGHSMGGYGTWSLAMSHPDLFAAIAPVSGGGNPAGMAKIAKIPELVVHGDNDKTVPVERSREMVAAAKAQGIELKYVEIPGGDHLTAAARTFSDVFDWFDAHKR
jgi:predicted esterase